jgi:hypothetical protein
MDLLAVSERSVQAWTKDAREAEKEALRLAVIDSWLNCEGSNREIAERFGTDHKTVAAWAGEFAQNCGNSPAGRTDKAPWGVVQHFDLWAFPTADKDGGGAQSYFGALPPQVVQNLLWFFTGPGSHSDSHRRGPFGVRAVRSRLGIAMPRSRAVR